MVRPIIFQIVGYQNSGKTTITTKLIQSLSIIGLKTVTLKHHGHGGKPDIQVEKDSARHLSAGAAATLVEGGGRIILQAENFNAPLEEQIKFLCLFEPDVILIEGYKRESYPKLLILRDQADLPLLESTTNVRMVFYWDTALKEILKTKCEIPFLPINDEMVIAQLSNTIQGLVQKIDEKS